MRSLLLLAIILCTVWLMYEIFRLLRKKIDPSKSALHFLAVTGISFLLIFLLSFCAGWIILHYRNFFFTK